MGDFSNPFQDRSEIMRHADIEAKDAEIARLRAALANARREGMEEAARIAELEALLKRADDIANWTGEDLICAGRSYASVVQAYKNDRATAKEAEP